MTSFSASWGDLPKGDYVVISPYLVDPNTSKKVNVGDGFIMDSSVKLIGAKPTAVFSSRIPLTDNEIGLINESRLVLVAGANILKDDFEIATGFDKTTMQKIKVSIVLCGIGHYGVPAQTQNGFSLKSKDIVSAALERFPYISVRCDASWRYVVQSLPELEEKTLMTSCPVVFPVDGIDHRLASKEKYEQLVVTVTDRAMLEQQLGILKVAPKLFPANRKILALHQDYGNSSLWEFANKLGYEVFRSKKYEDFLGLYNTTDIHFGNRVHAHLKCLSLGVRSYLTPFDLRQSYFAESLDFPLITKVPDPLLEHYDFNRMLLRRNTAAEKMNVFVQAVKNALGLTH
jgi:hypothetical protein